MIGVYGWTRQPGPSVLPGSRTHSPAVLTLVTCPAQDKDPVWIFGKVSQWPGPEQSLKTWEWPIYQMPPFLRQEVAPRAVVFVFLGFFFFFPTLSGLVVWK